MKKRTLIVVVGLLVSVLSTPIAWAEDGRQEAEPGWWETVVRWITDFATSGADPIGSPDDAQLRLEPTADYESISATPEEEDRQGSIDPVGTSAQ